MLKCLKDNCTGCNVCVASCPVNAIQLEYSDEGFWYPVINEKECIKCGKCNVMCPVQNKLNHNKVVSTYAAYTKNESILQNSSSGGLFYEFAKKIVSNGGVVVGAAYDYNFNEVRHRIVDNYNDLFYLMGSKYVQSFISSDIFTKVKEYLNSNKSVLFTGTPCQVAAIINYCSNNEKLFTIDVVCHGVPSPKAWKSYLKYSKSNSMGKLEKVSFRSKANGWSKFEMELIFSDYKYSKWFNEDLWGKNFIHNVYLRESCYSCKFKEANRFGDISLADFWGKGIEYNPTDRGCSLVIINNQKGKNLFEDIKGNIVYIESSYEIALEGNYALLKSSERYPKRKLAFKLLNKNKDFDKISKRLFYNNIFIRLSKKVYNKLVKWS